MTRKEYVVVKIPTDLSELTDKLIGKYGFKSRAEVVKEALRTQLIRYEGLTQGR